MTTISLCYDAIGQGCIAITSAPQKAFSFRGGSRIFLRRGCTSKEWRHWQWAKKFLKVNTFIRNFISGGVRTPCTLPLDPPLSFHSNCTTQSCDGNVHSNWVMLPLSSQLLFFVNSSLGTESRRFLFSIGLSHPQRFLENWETVL